MIKGDMYDNVGHVHQFDSKPRTQNSREDV